MRASVTITDLKGSESRSRSFEFDYYLELSRQVGEFVAETNFRKIDVQIVPLDDLCDSDILDAIADGSYDQ